MHNIYTPDKLPSIPSSLLEAPYCIDTSELCISVFFLPHQGTNKSLGGDSFIISDERALCIATLSDATGHGADGAKAHTNIQSSLEDIVSLLSRNILDIDMLAKILVKIDENTALENSFTLSLVRYEDERLWYGNFGENRLLVKRNGCVQTHDTQAPKIGYGTAFGNLTFEDYLLTFSDFNNDDMLLMYTDGVVDAANKVDWSVDVHARKLLLAEKSSQDVIGKVNQYVYERLVASNKAVAADDYTIIGIDKKSTLNR